jgi:hypothetical protein
MEPYTVVWSGEIEKRMRDQQIRTAPPIDENQKARGFRLRGRFAKSAKSPVGLTLAAESRLFSALWGQQTRKKPH